MVIRTSDNEYPVIGVMENTEQYDTHICRDVSGKGLCRILSVKDTALFPELVSFLTDTVNREAFTDYIEHFVDSGKLCIVMKYTQGITLSTKLATESVPFKERIELGRKILERAVVQDIPDYFLAKCFVPDRMIIAADSTVSFNYPIDDIITDREQNGRKNIEEVLRLLFAEELERKVPDLLIDFFDRLPELTEQRLLDIYSEYYTLAGQLENYDAKDELPKTFWYILWDKIKKLFKVLKTFLIIALILASIGYLIYTIIDPDRNKDNNGHFDSIGTVKIVHDGETTATGSTEATDLSTQPTDAPTVKPTQTVSEKATEVPTAAATEVPTAQTTE